MTSTGERAEALHLVCAGRLAAVTPHGGRGAQVTRILRPGDLVGGRELLTGTPYADTVTALRDSRLSSVPAALLERLLGADPALLAELARHSLSAIAPADGPARTAGLLGFVAVCDSVPMRDFAERLAVQMRALGSRTAVVGREVQAGGPAALSALEDAHDLVILAAERADDDFTEWCGRQIDRLVLVGGAASPLPEGPFSFAALAIQRHRLLDLILIQPPDGSRPQGSARWCAAAPAARLFHVREGRLADLQRLARVFTGRSVGVALSGGGARAYAHVGVLRALHELEVPVDFVAGTSMGAVVGAGCAMGWEPDELAMRVTEALVRSSPLQDIAFPLLALSRGLEVERRLREHFGEADMADLWRPLTCISTNLTTGELKAHREGRLRDALRASISLPGVLPPVVADGQVLVDGALVRNLPIDIVREQHEGVTIGVEVARLAGLTPDELRLQPSGLRWLWSGAWKKGPPIVSVLIRAATVPTARSMVSGRSAADVLIEPELGMVGLRDWKAFEPAVEAGRTATLALAEAIAASRAARDQMPAYHS